MMYEEKDYKEFLERLYCGIDGDELIENSNIYDEIFDELSDLIETHFELLEEYKDTRRELECCYEMMSNPKPYEFEDIKTGMFIYGYDSNQVYKIDEVIDKHCIKAYSTGMSGYSILDFDEEELYPVHMANSRNG